MESCISEIKAWMLSKNWNSVMVKWSFCISIHTKASIHYHQYWQWLLSCNRPNAQTLGVLLDSDTTLSPYITSLCKAAKFHPCRLAHIKKYLTPKALNTAVNDLISSGMDYHNSLLIGLLNSHVSRLQHIMNCAAHLISGVLGDLQDIWAGKKRLFFLIYA